MSIYRLVDGIAYCHIHEREWLEGEGGCQEVWAVPEEWADCVESPLYWLDRTQLAAPIVHLFKDHDRHGRVRAACGRHLRPLTLATSIHDNVTCRTCAKTKQFRNGPRSQPTTDQN